MLDIDWDNTIHFHKEPVEGMPLLLQRIDVDNGANNGPEVSALLHRVITETAMGWNPVKREREEFLVATVDIKYEGKLIRRPAWWPGIGGI
jgi:hypothetical protein